MVRKDRLELNVQICRGTSGRGFDERIEIETHKCVEVWGCVNVCGIKKQG